MIARSRPQQIDEESGQKEASESSVQSQLIDTPQSTKESSVMGYDNGRNQSQLLHTKGGWGKTAMITCSLPKIQDLAETGEEEISRKSQEILTSCILVKIR